MLKRIFILLIVTMGFTVSNAQVILNLNNNSNETFTITVNDAVQNLISNYTLVPVTGSYNNAYPNVVYPLNYTVTSPSGCNFTGVIPFPPFNGVLPINCSPNANTLTVSNTLLGFPPGWSNIVFVAN